MKRLIDRELGFESKKLNSLNLFNQYKYLCLCVITIVLSACFPDAEMQFLVLSLITGAKWIVDCKSREVNIVIRKRRW